MCHVSGVIGRLKWLRFCWWLVISLILLNYIVETKLVLVFALQTRICVRVALWHAYRFETLEFERIFEFPHVTFVRGLSSLFVSFRFANVVSNCLSQMLFSFRDTSSLIFFLKKPKRRYADILASPETPKINCFLCHWLFTFKSRQCEYKLNPSKP